MALGLVIALIIVPAQTLQLGRAVMQPAALPMACGLAMVLCGLAIVLKPMPDSGSAMLVPVTGAVTLALISYFGMRGLGFVIMAPALVLLMMLYMGERRWLWLGVGTLLVPLGIWLCFVVLLGRQLP
ncbi:MAG: tripartite tricarboxylate transporter TctB family protein [Pararhodobacter sp.]|nr:tripartite tricarboxylate transporter TctB family protein [Pararhodobacter sp.]